jgi:hypothetical protein
MKPTGTNTSLHPAGDSNYKRCFEGQARPDNSPEFRAGAGPQPAGSPPIAKVEPTWLGGAAPKWEKFPSPGESAGQGHVVGTLLIPRSFP